MADYSERELWHPTQVVGSRVALRRPRPDDLPGVVRWYRDPEIARLTRYQTRQMTQAEIERFFQVRMLAVDALAYTIVELPDNQAAAAVALAVNSTGLVSVRTVVLMTPAEVDAAAGQEVGYVPPGG